MDEMNYQPKWGERHDAIVKRYEARKKAGTVRGIVIVARDEQLP